MHSAGNEGDRCPMCDTRLHSVHCEPCGGTGRWLLFRCTVCAGTGKMKACPNFFSHPGLGPQGPFVRASEPGILRAEAC
jgi:hypothetical protein